MENCQQCQRLLTKKSKEYVDKYLINTNKDLFDQLMEDIESLRITEWEKMVLIRQINVLRCNCRKLNLLIC